MWRVVSLLLVLSVVLSKELQTGSDYQKEEDFAEEQKQKLDKLKQDFEDAVNRFEDKEAAQLCVAIAGKADMHILVNKLKSSPEVIALDKTKQSEV